MIKGTVVSFIDEIPVEEATEILTHVKEFLEVEKGVKGKALDGHFEESPTNEYSINWACIWNSPKHRGKKVQIAFKDEQVAFVFIDGTLRLTGEYLYRLTDLSPVLGE